MEFPVVKHSHVVPQMYLRLFADPGGYVAVRTPGRGKTERRHVKRVGTRDKFYARERPDGEEIYDIEWSLSTIESVAAPLLRSVADEWPLARRERGIVAEFFAIQLVRGPRWLDWHEEFTQDYLRELREKGEDAEEVSLLGDALLTKTETFIKMIGISRKVTSIMASMQWTLVEFPQPWLVTSDHPVALWPGGARARGPEPAPRATGLFETLEIRVPLSPNLALVMTWADESDSRMKGTKQDAAGLNAFTVAEAELEWFHQPGISPPVASGSILPLSPRVVPGYGVMSVVRSARRKGIQAIIEPTMGQDSFDQTESQFVELNVSGSP